MNPATPPSSRRRPPGTARPVSRRITRRWRGRSIVVAVAAAAGLGGCRDRGGAEEPRVTLTVSAAASLQEAITELDSLYHAEHPDVAVRANFGASGALRQQIEQGAPVDVFVSASERHIDALQQAQLIDPRTRRVLAGNELVLVVPAASVSPVTDFRALAQPAVKRVAIGAAASVPAGEYADETLRSLGIADSVGKKAVYGQNVRQVLAYVESGNVDAGIVYRTDAAVSRKVRIAAVAPAATHQPITYPLAVVARTAHGEDARSYAAFLLGPKGREVLARHGFTTP